MISKETATEEMHTSRAIPELLKIEKKNILWVRK